MQVVVRSHLGRAALIVALLASSMLVLRAAPAQAVACSAESQDVWVDAGGTCDQTADDGTVVKETVTYSSGGLTITGIVCRPKAAGDYPILVANHGGFSVAGAVETGACDEWARTYGYIVIASDYRTVNVGTPNDDACLGEVDDVLNMLALAATHADADEDRVVMRGLSHGGCVTLRAYRAGVPGLQAAAALAPPTDIDAEWTYLNASYTANGLCPLFAFLGIPPCAFWLSLRTQVETSTGGVPSPTTQAAYDARSAIEDPDGLADPSTPLLIAQGVTDNLVPNSQACSLADAVNDLSSPAPDFETYHYTNTQALVSTTPTGCTGYGFTFPTTGDPTTNGFPASHYLFLYDGWGHDLGGEYTEVLADVDAFLRTNNP